ncbi:glycosyltransferase family 39 protein [Streptomyces sp. NPDC050504]|uniref:glycosyltransferase family 39 protein n=1 Tax=Streptomyces sp. NPDC050504 TaxID=3365618 RepID=UPI003788939E
MITLTTTAAAPGPGRAARHRVARRVARRAAALWRGRPDDAPWVRPALLALLAATGLLYLYDLGASGYANSFYSAAAQAGGQSWKAFFFGSLDPANAITVDKPPAALWPMALSVRLFGLGSWQILVPQALMGTATVAVLYAAVRLRFSAAAGLLAGAVLALTPVAALMFRFNNPDALLTLLLTAAVYFVLRALADARTKWLVGAGAVLGLAFLAKTLQAFVVLPPLALVYAVCGPTTLRGRLGRLAAGTGAMVVAGGWWVAAVELWPKSSRPYVGGSQHNSFLELTFGYNGLGRLNGDETGSVGGGGRGGAGMPEPPAGAEGQVFQGGGGGGRGGGWGETGVGRMFDDSVGGQISWLLPAALLLLVAGLVVTRRAARTDTARAAFLVWGGVLLTTLAVFSFMAGIFHEYYTVALAPPIAALVGTGATVLWEERRTWAASAALAGAVAVSAVWAYELLGRTPDFVPWLRWAVLVAGGAAALGLLFAGRVDRRLALGAAGLGLAASLAGPVAYVAYTVDEGHAGSIVTAGPRAAGGGPGGMRVVRFTGDGGDGGDGGPGGGGGAGRGQRPPQGGPGGQGFPGGGPGGQGGRPGGVGAPSGARGPSTYTTGIGGLGGLLGGAAVGDGARARIAADADAYTWAAATVGAQNAASYQLATGEPVMAIGGFNGSDPSPTLARFKEYVAEGRIHYFIGSGGGGRETGPQGGPGGPGGGTSGAISSWVAEHFTALTVDGATFYDLTAPKA